MAMNIHGRLLTAVLSLLPKQAQLWIATHSSGIVRRAYDAMRESEDVAFLDFSQYDYDERVEMTPCVPDRLFWRRVYSIALDDLSSLVAPKQIVISEGSQTKADKGFDADCYNRIFEDTHPDTLFISYGGASQVEGSEHLISVLGAVARGICVGLLIDRDDMSDGERMRKIGSGVRVLGRRELENYLYDPGVLRTFCHNIGREDITDGVIMKRNQLLGDESDNPNMKAVTRDIFDYIRLNAKHGRLGRRRDEFVKEYLVPALKATPDVLEELERDVFG